MGYKLKSAVLFFGGVLNRWCGASSNGHAYKDAGEENESYKPSNKFKEID